MRTRDRGDPSLIHKAFRSSAGKLFWDVVARVLGFLVSVFIARRLGAAGYGHYAVLWYLAWMTAQITDLGLHLVVLRNLSREGALDLAGEGAHKAAKGPRPARLLVAGAIASKGALTVASLASATLAAAWSVGTSVHFPSLALLYAASLIASWTELFGVVLRSQGRLGLEGAVLGLVRAGWLVGAVVALERGGGLLEIGLALTLGSLPGLVLAGALAYRQLGFRWGLASMESLSMAAGARALLRQTAPLALTSIITLAYLRLDVLLLAWLRGAEAAGLFAASFRLFEALFLFSGAIVSGAFPLIAARVGQRGLEGLSAFVVRLLLWTAFPATVGFTVLAEPIIGLLYGPGYALSAGPLRVLAAGIVAVYINALTSHLLVATGRGRALVTVMAVRLTVALGLDLALIPALGPVGAAAAVVAAEWSLTVVSLACTRQILRPSAVLKEGLVPGACALAAAAAMLVPAGPVPLRIALGGLVYGAAFLTSWLVAAIGKGPLRSATRHLFEARGGITEPPLEGGRNGRS
ncbi:MAG: oligosaccharide flippase family protein [Acidobacteriota bacterium]